MRKNSKSERAFSGKVLLELYAAAFILLGPSALGGALSGWGIFAVFILTAAVFAVRIIETGRIHISVNILLGGAYLLYALFVLIWSNDRAGHMRLIFTALTMWLFAMLAADYFDLERNNDIAGRLAGMTAMSAFICGIWNIAAWGIFHRFVPGTGFDAGLGSRELVGCFMLLGLWCWRRGLIGVRRLKGRQLVLCVPMIFVLIMSRSRLTWLFAGLFALWAFIRKGKKGPAAIGGVLAALSALDLIFWGGSIRPFVDAMVCGLSNAGGLGGGGFLLRQTEFQSVYYSVDRLGLGADIFSSLGLAGLLIFLAAVGWAAYMAFVKGSVFCAFGGFLCVFAFLVPGTAPWLMLLTGVLIYGEWGQAKTISIRLRAGKFAFPVLLAAVAVYGCVLGVGYVIRDIGAINNNGQLLALASRMNPLDGESCFMAAKAYHCAYKDGGDRSDLAYAGYYIELAIKRCGETGPYRAEYAAIKADGGDMAAAVEMDELAMELAPLWDDCRVQAAEHLCAIIETARRGSLTAQNYHQSILRLADQVEDMEKKKIINDYADKAQPYTRMEFEFEQSDTWEEEE